MGYIQCRVSFVDGLSLSNLMEISQRTNPCVELKRGAISTGELVVKECRIDHDKRRSFVSHLLDLLPES